LARLCVCPNIRCPYKFRYDDESVRVEGEKATFKCPYCLHEYCMTCKTKRHQNGETCLDYQNKVIEEWHEILERNQELIERNLLPEDAIE